MPENVENRPLSDLRVVDLRGELEKRGLDKTGSKQVLIDRLQKVMKEEGEKSKLEDDKKIVKQAPDSSEDTVTNEKEKIEASLKEPPKEDLQKNLKAAEPASESSSFIQLTLEEGESLQDEEVEQSDSTSKSDSTMSKKTEGESPAVSKDQMKAKVVPPETKKEDLKRPIGVRSKIQESRNLWITNITKTTRAAELKQLLSAHGKVLGAKVVINAKHPGARCYGYVTMASVKDADNCIAKLNNSELNGIVIKIEKERPDSSFEKLKSKALDAKNKMLDINDKSENKDIEPNKDDIKNEELKSQAEDPEDKQPDSTNRKSRSRDLSRHGSISSTTKKDSLLTYEQIKEKQERQRYHKRLLQEENRRRREEATRRREFEKIEHAKIARLEREREKLHDEKEKLRSDKEKLRYEKEKLDREKDRIIKLEREINLEKLELEREKARFQEERRAFKRSAEFRRSDSFDDRKRVTTERHFEDGSTQIRFEPHGRYNEHEHEHGHEHNSGFTQVREERTRRPMPEIKDDPRTAARFMNSSQDTQRFERSAGASNNWQHLKAIPVRNFGSETWRANTPHRWTAGSMTHAASTPSAPGFQGSSAANVGPSCPPPPVINNYGARFEYKPSTTMRKY